MTFLNPAILFGLLGVLLPVAIHLLSKPRLKRIKWAATRFLIQSVQKNRRRVQIEDLILLILRCLLVALLVLLFARPAFLTDASGLQLNHEASTAVIILDNSASMGQSDGIKTRFEQAKSMADDILGKLGPGSSCALYLATDRAKAVIPKPTQDFAILRRSIDQAALSDGGSDLLPALKTAVDVLKATPGHSGEIFVLTDSQIAAWRELGPVRQLQDQAKKDVVMHFLTVGDKGEDNLAVTGLEMSGAVAAVNQPLRCAVTVSNWGKAGVDHVPVKLSIDDQPPQDEGMIDHIDPGTSKIINLVARFRDSGHHSITATIPGDRLPSDNQRTCALLVLDQIRALVVEGTSNPDPVARDGFFLRHALVPVSPDQADQYYVKVSLGQTNDLESSTLNEYEMVFLCNVAQLTPRGAQNVRQYVNQGGALIVFSGPTTDSNFYDNDPNFGALMPAKLAPAQEPPAGQKALSWQSKGYEHPLTTLWNNPESGNLGSVRVTKYFPLTLKPAADATSPAPQVVVKYADGEPAVVEQSFGKGKVILFSSSASTAWTTLPIHPAFVPLLVKIVSYVTNGLGGSLNILPGQAFSSQIDSEYAGKEVSVLRPEEKKRRVVGKVESGEQSAVLRYADTEKAGPYQLFVGDDPKPKVVFAVQQDPTESNLAQEAKADLDPLIAAAAASEKPDATAAAAEQTDKPRQKVPGQELWFPLALAALLLAVGELALAHRSSQSR